MSVEFWTDARVQKLRSLWARRMRTAVIAKRIDTGCTKNMVVGKANRIGLRMPAAAQVENQQKFYASADGRKCLAQAGERSRSRWADPKWRESQCRLISIGRRKFEAERATA